MKKYQSYINGKWIDSTSGKTIAVDNPATEEIIGEVACATKEDVDIAVEAAKNSFKKRLLVDLNPIDRAKLMRQIAIELRKKGLINKIKPDNTPVTNGDIEVNNIITNKPALIQL